MLDMLFVQGVSMVLVYSIQRDMQGQHLYWREDFLCSSTGVIQGIGFSNHTVCVCPAFFAGTFHNIQGIQDSQQCLGIPHRYTGSSGKIL